jgi:hypothetical protein
MLCTRPPELRNSRALQTKVIVYCAFVFKMEKWRGSRLQLNGNFFTRGDIVATICRAWRIVRNEYKKGSELTEWPCSNQFSNSISTTNEPLHIGIHICWNDASDEDLKNVIDEVGWTKRYAILRMNFDHVNNFPHRRIKPAKDDICEFQTTSPRPGE